MQFVSPNRKGKKSKEILITNLMDDFNLDYENGEFQHLYTTNINFDNFEIIKVIGRGSYAKVYLIKKVTDEGKVSKEKYYALKVIKKKDLYDKDQLHHTL